MNDNNRELSVNSTVTVIENLSNELFYEIFDYLDGCDIYEAFSNLNNRFGNLFRHSPLSLKINLSSKSPSVLKHYYEQMIAFNKHRTISIKISNGSTTRFITKCITLSSSFDCLQSLNIAGIHKIELKSFLLQLSSLPRLYALNISIHKWFVVCHAELYLPIFRLPVLKYAKISSNYQQSSFISSSLVPIENFSTLEDLSIKKFTLDALINMISHTPKLRRLICDQLFASYGNDVRIRSKILPNLTHLTINCCDELFTKVTIFIREISFQLQVLRLTVFNNRDYLDAVHWESMIIQHMPHLRTFEFHFYDFLADNFVLEPHHKRLERFLSSFWIERQWFLEFTIDRCSSRPTVIYSVVPYKHRKAITYSEPDSCATISSSMQPFPCVELNFQPSRNFKNDHVYIKNISAIFTVVSITTLNIEYDCSQQLLLNIVSFLPNLNSLSVLAFSSTESPEKYQTLYQSVLTNNKLTTIIFKKMTQSAQVHFLIDLCPRMKYFEVKYHHDIDLELLVRVILMKHIPQLRSLCLCNGLHDDRMVKKLQAIIEREKCTIKRVLDRIYLIWK